MLIAIILINFFKMIMSNLCLINLEIQDQAPLIIQLLSVVFLAILFIQSGLDKVMDKEGNLSWLTSHFANSPLKNAVPFLLLTITVVELLAGFGNLVGGIYLFLFESNVIALVGTLLSSLALVMLFFGQRIAKDYAGAQSLASYFILTILTVLLLLYF